jgi:hypothetical protein
LGHGLTSSVSRRYVSSAFLLRTRPSLQHLEKPPARPPRHDCVHTDAGLLIRRLKQQPHLHGDQSEKIGPPPLGARTVGRKSKAAAIKSNAIGAAVRPRRSLRTAFASLAASESSRTTLPLRMPGDEGPDRLILCPPATSLSRPSRNQKEGSIPIGRHDSRGCYDKCT